jgi:dihydroneopterin aldolase/2-amino-4-hydroxy-6-hydroxymethyldihydropteridine diphosphokinase
MIIKIKNLTTHMILGVYEFEKRQKQKVVVNLEIDFDEKDAAITDDISDTLNYHPICDKVTEILQEKPYQLIETVVQKIGDYIMDFEIVNSCIVEIDKPEAPIDNVESLSVTQHFKSN